MMRLTWKDAVATALTGLVVAAYVTFLVGTSLPVVSGVRGLAAAVLVVGLVGCALGGAGASDASAGRWSRTLRVVASFLGAVALFAAIVALVVASKVVLAVLVGAVVALWVVATVRHAFSGRGRIEDRDLHTLIERERTPHRG
jgi:4-amino-4-deoxy-L-arabinose transferase-like glycosyltransferase